MAQSPEISKLPLGELKALGIDEKMLESMPEDVRKALVAGRLTPLIQAKINLGNGVVVVMPAKLQVVTGEDGTSHIILHGVQNKLSNKLGLSEREMRELKEGKIISAIVTKEGVRKSRLLQLDPQLNNIIEADPAKLKIQERLRDFEKVRDIELGTEQKNRVRKGEPVELAVGGEKVTLGLDLRSPEGIRTLNGGLDEWKRTQAMEYDIAHPEYRGYVMTDKNEWEYQQVVKAKSEVVGEAEKAKQELSKKSGFHL